MILAQLDEEARQTIILALTELRRRRPGWSEYLTTLINATFGGGQVIADELDRLHDDLGAAYASTWSMTSDAGPRRAAGADDGRPGGDHASTGAARCPDRPSRCDGSASPT